jgi:methionyl-tRNA formyltransferase
MSRKESNLKSPTASLSLTFSGSKSVWCLHAIDLLRGLGHSVTLADQHGDQTCNLSSSDWLVSFKADRIWTAKELSLPSRGAINFHLGPPWYRGVGGYEAAIQERWESYGVTAHHMTAQIDAGPIISTSKFGIPSGIHPQGLAILSASVGLMMIAELLSDTSAIDSRRSTARWSGPLHTHGELANRLSQQPELMRAPRPSLEDPHPCPVGRPDSRREG